MRNITPFLFIAIIVILLAASCGKEDIKVQTDSTGAIVTQSYLWKKPLHEKG